MYNKVSNLMMADERKWDIEVIDDLFDDRDSALIKRIPLSIHVNIDSWYWLLDEKGVLRLEAVIGDCKGSVVMIIRNCGKRSGL